MLFYFVFGSNVFFFQKRNTRANIQSQYKIFCKGVDSGKKYILIDVVIENSCTRQLRILDYEWTRLNLSQRIQIIELLLQTITFLITYYFHTHLINSKSIYIFHVQNRIAWIQIVYKYFACIKFTIFRYEK